MATAQFPNSPNRYSNNKPQGKVISSIKMEFIEQEPQPMKTLVKPVTNTRSDFEDPDLEARIESLRQRYKYKAPSRSTSQTKGPSPQKSISVEKIKIEAPKDQPLSKNITKPQHREDTPTEYNRGRSRGHKRTVSISFSAKSDADTNLDQSTVMDKKSGAKKTKIDEFDKVQPTNLIRNKDSLTQKNTESYSKAVCEADKTLFRDNDPLNSSSKLKSKLAVANKREELKRKKDKSMQKTLKSKKEAHDTVKIEKEKIREKIHQNAQIDTELNQRKKLLVEAIKFRESLKKKRPDIKN